MTAITPGTKMAPSETQNVSTDYFQLPTLRELVSELYRKSDGKKSKFPWRDLCYLIIPVLYVLAYLIYSLILESDRLYGITSSYQVDALWVTLALFFSFMVQLVIQIKGVVVSLNSVDLSYAADIDKKWAVEKAIIERVKHLRPGQLKEMRSRLNLEIQFRDKSAVIIVGVPLVIALLGKIFPTDAASIVMNFFKGCTIGILVLAAMELEAIKRLKRLCFVIECAEEVYKREA